MRFTFNEKYKDNLIVKETFEFALLIVVYAEMLEHNRKYVIARQLLKSGTSIGANVKEADETEYWLFLCQASETYPNCAAELKKLQGILKILNKIIGTSKNRS